MLIYLKVKVLNDVTHTDNAALADSNSLKCTALI